MKIKNFQSNLYSVMQLSTILVFIGILYLIATNNINDIFFALLISFSVLFMTTDLFKQSK